jgi:hypothetical protein
MTVHWNSRRGFAAEPQTTSSADAQAAAEEKRLHLVELLWAMRKTPDQRSRYLQRARKLVADPAYPPEDIIKVVAKVLAKDFSKKAAD